MKKLTLKPVNQQGIIPMLIMIVGVLAAALFLIYLRVASGQR